MTIVLVHGVPETSAIWAPLRAELGRETTVLSLPGFGCERPVGFGATKDEYAEWLVRELQQIDGPIDLVGHDWGGILTARIMSTHRVAVRSWVSDAAGAIAPDFEWHALAKVWQTPGDGEAFWEGMLADLTQAAGLFAAVGVPADHATAMSLALDQTLVESLLDLYRSSAHLGRDWAHNNSAVPNGLVIVGGADGLGDVNKSQAAANALGAAFATIEDAGHFWPLDSPAAGARALESFWSQIAD